MYIEPKTPASGLKVGHHGIPKFPKNKFAKIQIFENAEDMSPLKEFSEVTRNF
jgi:hypothetical protein